MAESSLDMAGKMGAGRLAPAGFGGINPRVTEIASKYEGRAIRPQGSDAVFLVQGGRKFGFESFDAWLAYGLDNGQGFTDANNWTRVSVEEADSIPTGGSVNARGVVIPAAQTVLEQPQMMEESINLKARSLANEFVKQFQIQKAIAASGRVFTRFEPVSDILDNQQVQVTSGLFSSNAATMSVIFTSSLQSTTSKNYYYEAWNGTATTSEAQFSVAYGHRRGSGSSAAGTLNDSPSRAIYSQYRLLLLNPGDTTFTFGNGASSDSIYAINYNRARLKDRMDPGNWQMTLAQLSGSTVPNASHTGSNVRVQTLNPNFITLIDDSGDVNNTGTTGLGNVYNIVSGSLTNGIFNPSAPIYYGLMYPALGVVILNDTALNASASFNSVTGSNVAGDNAWKLFTSISGAMSASVNYAMQARNIETITSTHYFVRVKNGEYNFSNNPTFVTGSVGEFSQATFIGDPKTYLTTIGMYNDRQELLAVAKLSQPVQKSFSVETLIKVKLDF
jgi:hypothetical protein